MKKAKQAFIFGMALCVSLSSTMAHAAWPFSESKAKFTSDVANDLERILEADIKTKSELEGEILPLQRELELRAEGNTDRALLDFDLNGGGYIAIGFIGLMTPTMTALIIDPMAEMSLNQRPLKNTLNQRVQLLTEYRAQLASLAEVNQMMGSETKNTALMAEKMRSFLEFSIKILRGPKGEISRISAPLLQTIDELQSLLKQRPATEAEMKVILQHAASEINAMLKDHQEQSASRLLVLIEESKLKLEKSSNLRVRYLLTVATISSAVGGFFYMKAKTPKRMKSYISNESIQRELQIKMGQYLQLQDRIAATLIRQSQAELKAMESK